MIKISLYVDKDKFASTTEAREILGISLSLFHKLKQMKLVKATKIGKSHYYKRSDLNETILKKYMESLEKKV